MSNDERIIMVMAEPGNGDGYIFATTDAQREIERLEKWSAPYRCRVRESNEAFERLARPLMAIRDQDPSRGN